MNYNEAFDKLNDLGQTHVLDGFNGLSADKQAELLEQIDRTDFSVLRLCSGDASVVPKGEVTPIKAMQLDEIKSEGDRFEEIGLNVITDSKVAAVLLAGGMGTRLGSDDPKGMYNIGITKDVFIFQRLIENLMDVTNKTGNWVYLFVMTSDKNHDVTVKFFNEHNFFGYNGDYVKFFKQEMAPACDYSGKVYMEEPYRIATSPNGNGGWFSSMISAGIADIVEREGIEWLNVFAVDNVLQRICDPCFIGAVVDGGFTSGAKVVRKAAPDEKVGVMCLEDGRPSIVEYYELTPELMQAKDEKGDPAYNFGVILNYLFNTKELLGVVRENMPLHRVEKKIPYISAAGEYVKPQEPNGYKFETLILDMIHLFPDCLPYEVVREHEFAPIKNKTGIDSVESARKLCELNGIVL